MIELAVVILIVVLVVKLGSNVVFNVLGTVTDATENHRDAMWRRAKENPLTDGETK